MGIAKGHKYFTNDEKMPLVSRKKNKMNWVLASSCFNSLIRSAHHVHS